jgi:hypothetical protein
MGDAVDLGEPGSALPGDVCDAREIRERGRLNYTTRIIAG